MLCLLNNIFSYSLTYPISSQFFKNKGPFLLVIRIATFSSQIDQKRKNEAQFSKPKRISTLKNVCEKKTFKFGDIRFFIQLQCQEGAENRMFFHIGELNLKTLKNRHIYLSLPAARIILEKLGKIQEIVVQKGYPPKRTLSRELLYTENFVVENEKYKLELMPPRENELHDFDMKLCIVQENIVKKKGSIYFIHAKAIPIFQENIAKILKEYEKLGTVSSNESKKSYLEEYYRISLDIQTELDIIQEDETKSFKERVQASDRIYMKYDEILKQLKKKYGIERKEVLKILPQSEERSVILETRIEIPKKKELSLKEEEKPLEYGNEGPKFW